MIASIVKYFLFFVALVLVQVLVLNNVQISGYINPYVYVLFILLLPFETPGWLLLVLSFILGLSIDIFPQGLAGWGNTLGIHTAATVLLAFARPLVLDWINPRGEYESGTSPGSKDHGIGWFFLYVLILIGIHHFALFFLEDFSLRHFFHTFIRFVFSLFFTILLVLIVEGFRYRPRIN